MQNIWMMYLPIIIILFVVFPVLGLWGARRVRRDLFRLAGREEEDEDERA